MRISARLEYSVRAVVALAAAAPGTVKARVLADSQHIPGAYLYDILADLRRAELVTVQLGKDGGYALSRPAEATTIGDVLRSLGGQPTAGEPAGGTGGLADRLHRLWTAADQASLRILDEVTLADLAAGRLPEEITEP
jgi:Rrf2 family protein